MKLYSADSHDPYVNLAVEQALFARREEAVYLWRNAPCVVIGRNQNPYQEADLDYMKVQNVSLVRRRTGGGAVFQDLGNLNYSFFTACDSPSFIIGLVREVLADFGIAVEKSGRNDLLAGGRKISGTAFLYDDYYLYHGTLLVDVSKEQLDKCLTPSALKLQAKGIDSVRARVVNLRELSDEIAVEGLIQRFEKLLGTKAESVPISEQICRDAEKLRSDHWLYGESPQYEITLERRLSGSVYQFALHVEQGKIRDLKVYTDALKTPDTRTIHSFFLDRAFTTEAFVAMLEQCPVQW
jgi:lipoate-protein ligase A